jgi:hypothetical protein
MYIFFPIRFALERLFELTHGNVVLRQEVPVSRDARY